MRLEDETLGASVRVLRAATAAPADGEATRARVLGLLERGGARRAQGRRAGVVALAALASVTFGSVAWTALGHWRAQRPARALGASVAASVRRAPTLAAVASPGAEAPTAPAPPAPPPLGTPRAPRLASSSPSAPSDTETRAYARAHEAHFTRDTPAEALAAWNRYLAAYPSGAFAPDARYNRGLCLLRLGQHAAAAQALRPLADGAFHGYRRLEAAALLDWLERQPP